MIVPGSQGESVADTICVIGSKGGTGKTTLARMLSHGLGLLGQRSICVANNAGREFWNRQGLHYRSVGNLNQDALAALAEEIRNNPCELGVFDGESNNPILDQKLYELADLVLLPFRDSHEDLRLVLRDLEKFPRAYAVPCQWPTNQWQQRAAGRQLQELLGQYQGRILDPVYALSPTKLLLQSHVPESLPNSVNEACRNIARQILNLLTIHVSSANVVRAITKNRALAS
jgi:chromosome partitioning protein